MRRLFLDGYGQARAGTIASVVFLGLIAFVASLFVLARPAILAEREAMRSACAARGMTLTNLRQGSGKGTYSEGVCRDAEGRLYLVTP